MSEDVVLTVLNRHIEMCGKPPNLMSRAGLYTGYFENKWGEQAVFIYDRETHKATLWMGDAGWEKPHEVENGMVSDLILNDEGRDWLTLCWKTATQQGAR